jgi:Tol biopolymer transport system component
MYYYGPGWAINMTQRNSVTDNWTMGTGINELNTLGMVCSPTLTADELTIVFVGGNPTGYAQGADLYMASRTDKSSPFGSIVALTNVNSSFADIGPYLSPDGLSLYFCSGRNGNGQIFESTRNTLSDPFGAPQHLSAFDMPTNVGSPCLSSDGTALYFDELNQNGNYDIYVSYNVPEPATLLLFGLGIMALGSRRKNS